MSHFSVNLNFHCNIQLLFLLFMNTFYLKQHNNIILHDLQYNILVCRIGSHKIITIMIIINEILNF